MDNHKTHFIKNCAIASGTTAAWAETEHFVDEHLEDFASAYTSHWNTYNAVLPIIHIYLGCPAIIKEIDSRNYEAIVIPQKSRYFVITDDIWQEQLLTQDRFIDLAIRHQETKDTWIIQAWKELPIPIPLFYLQE